MVLNNIKNKNILILGLGREGEASFLFLRKSFPSKVLGLADKLELKNLTLSFKGKINNDMNVILHLGNDYLESVKNYDFIIKSPGIPPNVIKPYLGKDTKITSQTEIFFENCPGVIIGITGTKGKSTVSTLIYRVLKEGRIPDVHLIGNIGRPAIAFLEKATKESIFVYELSSHQLLGLKRSPHIAVLLNIYPEHLDYYRNFKEYADAKANITRWQTKKDFLIFNHKNLLARKIAKKSRARKFIFDLRQEKYPGCFKKSGIIYYSDGRRQEKVLKTLDIQLIGKFNTVNSMPAIIVGKIFNIPTRKIANAIRSFRGLPHRLEYVGEYRGIKFYNDSLATIPEATIEALDALGRDVETIIIGGYDRGLDFRRLAERLIKSNVKTMILFPTTGKRISEEVKKRHGRNIQRAFEADNMKDALNIAYKHTKAGKICLLSCASPSFGIFKDYRERGNLFKRYVKNLGILELRNHIFSHPFA